MLGSLFVLATCTCVSELSSLVPFNKYLSLLVNLGIKALRLHLKVVSNQTWNLMDDVESMASVTPALGRSARLKCSQVFFFAPPEMIFHLLMEVPYTKMEVSCIKDKWSYPLKKKNLFVSNLSDAHTKELSNAFILLSLAVR